MTLLIPLTTAVCTRLCLRESMQRLSGMWTLWTKLCVRPRQTWRVVVEREVEGESTDE